MARFVVAVAVSLLVVVSGSSCGGTTNRPDAGGSAGGLSGTGGGVSGGGSAGGGTAGGSTAGGSAAGGSAQGDGGLNCSAITATINWNGMAGSGSYELQNDGGVGIHYTGVVTAPSAAGPFTTVDVSLFNETPGTPIVFPVTGTFQAITGASTIYPVSTLGTNCMMNGSGCTQTFISTNGNYTITAATQDLDAGTFVGSLTQVRYREINPTTFQAVPDGGCVDVSTFNFNTRWP